MQFDLSSQGRTELKFDQKEPIRPMVSHKLSNRLGRRSRRDSKLKYNEQLTQRENTEKDVSFVDFVDSSVDLSQLFKPSKTNIPQSVTPHGKESERSIRTCYSKLPPRPANRTSPLTPVVGHLTQTSLIMKSSNMIYNNSSVKTSKFEDRRLSARGVTNMR